MRTNCAPRNLMMVCIVTLAALLGRKRASVRCQSHFKPIMHPYPHHLPMRNIQHLGARHQQVATHPMAAMMTSANKAGTNLMASLGGRGQSYLNHMVQQHQIRSQQQQHFRQVPMSDRRASAPTSSASANQIFPPMAASAAASHQQQAQVPFTNKFNKNQEPQIGADQAGKLLICYYTTKQTAPYWPKDGREFVVPADRLNQVVSSFSQASKSSQFGAAAKNKFSAREDGAGSGGQQHSTQNNLLSHDALTSARHNQQQQQEAHTIKHHNQAQPPQLNSFAGGRMIVVAPKFVPFNRSSGVIQTRVINEPITSDTPVSSEPELSPSFAQMFFMSNNEQQRHNTIANRQDNAASFTTTTTSAANQPPFGQLVAGMVVPQMADLVVSNNNDNNLESGHGGIVFDKTPRGSKQHDLNGGGPPLTIVNESQTKTNLPQQAMQLAGNQNNGQRPSLSNVNNYRQLERGAQMKDQQQQLIYSSPPPMSRTFIVGASVGALPLVTSQADPGQDQLLGQTVSLVNGDNSDYYHYYNQPSGSSPKNAGDSGGHNSATTLSLATTAAYRPAQQQQQHQLLQQKGKSLQVAESEISSALPTSSLTPITFVESPSGSPPSYSIGGIPGRQSQTLDRLIVSSGPTSTTTARQQLAQQYSSVSSPSQPVHLASFTSSANDLSKPSATGDDGLISSGTKTTPIASAALPSSSSSSSLSQSSSPSVASQQQQLVATLPSGLLISYPPLSTSIAPAQPPPTPPNGSSTAAAVAAASLTTNAQMSTGSSMANSDADTAAAANGGNNRHHHQHNNRQIVGVGGSSLSATLVSSPLSTMFDVFGAASQYLMRFKPSSLISPSSFASLNSIVGDSSSGHQHNPRSNSSSSPLISLPFAGGLLGGSSGLHHKSNASNSGFLSRLSLQTHQRREDICGRTIQTPERRIIGGEGAKYGEFPYQVHIKIAKHQCGGALIDKQSIVTAAHCVYHFITRAPVSKLQIVIGAYDIEDEQYQELPPQYFKVNRVKLHPNFRFSASHPDRYDIAILKLDKPVKYTDNVLPVCLPGKDLKYENMVGTVTGFGKTDPSLSNRYGTRLLQKVDVPIIENGECERWHRTRGIDLKIFPEMMCAGYEDGLKDACVGDSGGPLVVKTPVGSNGSFRWTLAGITSAGFGCAQSRQPGIYHRVSHTVDWILDNLD